MKLITTSVWARLAWYVPIGVVLVLLPVLKYAEPWWAFPRQQKFALLAACTMFAAGCLVTMLFEREEGWVAAARAALRSVAVFGVCLLGWVIISEPPRYLLVPVFLAMVLVPALSVSPLAHRRLLTLALAVLTAVAVAFVAMRIRTTTASEQVANTSYLNTAFYTVQATSHEGWIPMPATRGGGLDRIGERVLLGTGDGFLYLLEVPTDSGKPLQIEKLATRVPHNREEFAAAFGGSPSAPKRSSEYSEAGPPRVQTWRFRVADVIAKSAGERVRIFASHHYWKADEQCFVVRISELDASALDPVSSVAQGEWRTLYESSPCIVLTGPERKRGKNPFKGEEIGGRLALLDDQTLLLTLGDQGFSGIESLQAFAQDPQAAYGKTIRIDLASGAAQTFTSGHRNPQGLFVTHDKQIWSTEHGAQGGDELNLLEPGANYGWPKVTYGTDYGSTVWPVSRTQGRHEGFAEPRYVWTPSIGVSQVIALEGEGFPIWRNDLLAGSLSTRALYRLVTVAGRIVLSEQIDLGKRVRDLLELNDGRVLVWTDDGALVTIEQARGDSGEMLFATQCSGCHAIVDGLTHRLGPDLKGIDRAIASAAGFDEYSAALRAQQGEWTRARLDEFLRDPQAAIPGNSMAFAGITDAQQRTSLIEFLQRQSARE